MRPALVFAAALALTSPICDPAGAETARDFCPAALTVDCLDAVANHMLQAEPPGRIRGRMIVDRARNLAATEPARAMELLHSGWKETDDVALGLLALSMAKEGHTAEAREIFTLIRQARIENPEPSLKFLDLLADAGDMAEAGFSDLARETQVIAVGFLSGDATSPVAFSEELQLARLMGLYGWPEAAEPWFSATYDRIPEIPEGSIERGFALARFMSVARIIGNTALAERAARDLAAFYSTASPEVQAQVQPVEVAALAQAGAIDAAKDRARAWGISLAESLQRKASFFLDDETDYAPGVFPDTRARFDAMVAALESDAVKGEYLVALVRKLVYLKLDPEVDTLLPRVIDPAARAEMVAEVVAWLARDKKDPKAAADLFFAEKVDLVPDDPSQGSFVERYPLALMAEGLWDKGDSERGRALTATVLKMWAEDQDENRSPHSSLIRALAQAGQDALIPPWLEGARLPEERVEILAWAARGKAAGGDFDAAEDYLTKARAALDQVSNDPPERPKYWPKNLPMPTARDAARGRMDGLTLEIISAMARKDQVDRALKLWAATDKSQVWAWVPALEITRAETRTGRVTEAEAMRFALIDDLLSGALVPQAMPGLIGGFAQDIAAP